MISHQMINNLMKCGVKFNNFETYYKLLIELIKSKPFIKGINLDVEEQIGLDNIENKMKSLPYIK